MCVSDTGVCGRFDVREHERVLSLPLFTRLLYPSSLMPRSLHTPASVSVCLSAAMITRTSETFNHQPCAAVHRNAAIFELSELLTITCSRKNFMVILQRVQELSCWQQTHTHTHKQTLRYWKRYQLRCAGGNKNIYDPEGEHDTRPSAQFSDYTPIHYSLCFKSNQIVHLYGAC